MSALFAPGDLSWAGAAVLVLAIGLFVMMFAGLAMPSRQTYIIQLMRILFAGHRPPARHKQRRHADHRDCPHAGP